MTKELEKDYAVDKSVENMMAESQTSLMKLNFKNNKRERRFIPKKNLTYQEFLAIKHFYSGSDFEKSGAYSFALPLVGGTLWVAQKVL